MGYIEYLIFFKTEMIKDTIRNLMYLKVYFIFLYTNLFKGKYIIYSSLALIIMWIHLLMWLFLDITTTAVSYFNNKHSSFFF